MQNISSSSKKQHIGSIESLILEHDSLVKKIAHHLILRVPPHLGIDDLIQAGTVGLIESAYQYDQNKGASFTTYAGIRIRGAMLDEVRKADWAPRSVHQNTKKINQAVFDLESLSEGHCRHYKIAEKLQISLLSLRKMILDTHGSKLLSFEEVGMNHESVQPQEYQVNDPQTRAEESQLYEGLVKRIEDLSEKERLVIALYYHEDLNLKEIGGILEVSESRVSQILSKALKKLQISQKSF